MAENNDTDIIEQLKRDKNNITAQQRDIQRRMADFQKQVVMMEGAKGYIDQFLKRFQGQEECKK